MASRPDRLHAEGEATIAENRQHTLVGSAELGSYGCSHYIAQPWTLPPVPSQLYG